MVMFQERPLARLCALNPDTPGTKGQTVFVGNSRFDAATLLVGRQKQRSESD